MGNGKSQKENGQAGPKGLEGLPLGIFHKKGFTERVALEDLDTDLLVAALDGAINEGVLVGIGRTSDGGAIGVYLNYDGQREKAWAGNADELTELFQAIKSAYS